MAGAVEPEVAAVVAEPEPEIGIDGEERRAVAAEPAAPAEPPARPGLRGIVRAPQPDELFRGCARRRRTERRDDHGQICRFIDKHRDLLHSLRIQ